MKKNLLFLFRKNNDDRDRCGYIEDENFVDRFTRGRYFCGINIQGTCFCGSDFPKYEEIETVLSKEQYNDLVKISNEFYELGYNITMGDERFKKGMEVCERLEPILNTLRSEKAKEFFVNNIIKEEKAELAENYKLTEDEVEQIWANNPTEYEDKSIVSTVYDDVAELASEMCDDCCDIPKKFEQYFDYKRLGEDLVKEGDEYYKLESGRVVCYNL